MPAAGEVIVAPSLPTGRLGLPRRSFLPMCRAFFRELGTKRDANKHDTMYAFRIAITEANGRCLRGYFVFYIRQDTPNHAGLGTGTDKQDQRLALLFRQWLKSELLTDRELSNHYFLWDNYPVFRRRRRRREAGDESEEPLAQRARAAVDQIKSVDTDRLAGVLEPPPRGRHRR